MHSAFFNAMKCINGNIYLNLNPSIKFFQQERLSDTFYTINNPKRINEDYVGWSVMTIYNSRIYTISEVVFNKNPTNEFTLQNGKKISYEKYLLENYKVKLQYP